MNDDTFPQRFGLEQSKPIGDDFPAKSKIGLAYLLIDLLRRSYARDVSSLYSEILRTGRLLDAEIDISDNSGEFETLLKSLSLLKWQAAFTFCERVYSNQLKSVGHWDDEITWIEDVSLSDVRDYYSKELNLILAEDNVAFRFINGQFQRRGRAQTQKSFQRVGSVLSRPELSKARDHYMKARRFFDQLIEPDFENCVKEAICSLESCLETLTGLPASNDFARVIRGRQGNDAGHIPAPIAEGMVKLHAYRGSGQGVAHAAPQGNRVSELESELALNLVASYVTYLVDLLPRPDDEIPF